MPAVSWEDKYLNPAGWAALLTERGLPTSERQASRMFNIPGFPRTMRGRERFVRIGAGLNWLREREKHS
jgi:hypothetical protein